MEQLPLSHYNIDKYDYTYQIGYKLRKLKINIEDCQEKLNRIERYINKLNPNDPDFDNKINKLTIEKNELLNELQNHQLTFKVFTEDVDKYPEAIKTIFDFLIDLSNQENKEYLHNYLNHLKNINILNPDINFIISSLEQQIMMENAFNTSEEELQAAQKELTPTTLAKTYQKYIKLARYYDNTKQYNKADLITEILQKGIQK